MTTFLIIVLIGLGMAPVPAQESSGEMDLATLISRHRQSRLLIRSIETEVEYRVTTFAPNGRMEQLFTGVWLQDGDDFCGREKFVEIFPGGKTPNIGPYERTFGTLKGNPVNVTDGTTRLNFKGKAPQYFKSTSASVNWQRRTDSALNIWPKCLFVEWAGDNPSPYDEIFKIPEAVTAFRREKSNNGPDKLVVEWRSKAGFDQSVTFDPAVNFLVSERLTTFPEKPGQPRRFHNAKVLKFVEFEPGVYFPESITLTETNSAGQKSMDALTQLKNIKINQVIDPHRMEVSIPPKTWVHDWQTKTTYLTGPNGERTKETPMARGADATLFQTPLDADDGIGKVFWYGLVATGLLLSALALAMAWRRRRVSS